MRTQVIEKRSDATSNSEFKNLETVHRGKIEKKKAPAKPMIQKCKLH